MPDIKTVADKADVIINRYDRDGNKKDSFLLCILL